MVTYVVSVLLSLLAALLYGAVRYYVRQCKVRVHKDRIHPVTTRPPHSHPEIRTPSPVKVQHAQRIISHHAAAHSSVPVLLSGALRFVRARQQPLRRCKHSSNRIHPEPAMSSGRPESTELTPPATALARPTANIPRWRCAPLSRYAPSCRPSDDCGIHSLQRSSNLQHSHSGIVIPSSEECRVLPVADGPVLDARESSQPELPMQFFRRPPALPKKHRLAPAHLPMGPAYLPRWRNAPLSRYAPDCSPVDDVDDLRLDPVDSRLGLRSSTRSGGAETASSQPTLPIVSGIALRLWARLVGLRLGLRSLTRPGGAETAPSPSTLPVFLRLLIQNQLSQKLPRE